MRRGWWLIVLCVHHGEDKTFQHKDGQPGSRLSTGITHNAVTGSDGNSGDKHLSRWGEVCLILTESRWTAQVILCEIPSSLTPQKQGTDQSFPPKRLNTTMPMTVICLKMPARKDRACRTRDGSPKSVQLINSVGLKWQRAPAQPPPLHAFILVRYARAQSCLYLLHLCCQQPVPLFIGTDTEHLGSHRCAAIGDMSWTGFKWNREGHGCTDARQGPGWSWRRRPREGKRRAGGKGRRAKRLRHGDPCCGGTAGGAGAESAPGWASCRGRDQKRHYDGETGGDLSAGERRAKALMFCHLWESLRSKDQGEWAWKALSPHGRASPSVQTLVALPCTPVDSQQVSYSYYY